MQELVDRCRAEVLSRGGRVVVDRAESAGAAQQEPLPDRGGSGPPGVLFRSRISPLTGGRPVRVG